MVGSGILIRGPDHCGWAVVHLAASRVPGGQSGREHVTEQMRSTSETPTTWCA